MIQSILGKVDELTKPDKKKQKKNKNPEEQFKITMLRLKTMLYKEFIDQQDFRDAKAQALKKLVNHQDEESEEEEE